MTGPVLRVLLIEDNPNDAELILLELRRANGYTIQHERVETEEQFKKALDRHIWDFFFCDYALPKFSVERVLQLLTSRGIDTPLVLISGKITQEQARKVLGQRSVYGYINKSDLQGLGPLFRREIDLSRRYDELIELYAGFLGMRDHETEEHTKRVTDLTVNLARRMDVSEIDVMHMRRGAMMHDIGKSALPDSVLLKPGELTEDERYVMQQHPLIAYERLSKYKWTHPILDIPFCHHERFDGTGYPRGLKGEEIPLAARIFAVVDVYDALTSDRPYREAWSVEKTLIYISDNAGTMFDPAVVNAFMRMGAE